MMELYNKLSNRCSRITTNMYSTSFSLGVSCLHTRLRDPICAIYGFVRFADEIVDTFHDFNKAELLTRFEAETYRAIDERISLNPILHSFQRTVHHYQIERTLIIEFLKSMALDLHKKEYNSSEIKEYIVGSAEVVGLMCLRVFCEGNNLLFDNLAHYARKLGSAFQKVNFLRDLNADYWELGRNYFGPIRIDQWNVCSKLDVEKSIEKEFNEALLGIKQLPKSSRLGVYAAYVYYRSLFKKIRKASPGLILQKRIRVPNTDKARLLAYSYLKHQLNLI
jgi:15-cis-phytoene synthase